MQSSLVNALIPNGNFFSNRDGQTPRWIIVHGTAGGSSAQAIAQYFQSAQVSSHYVIGQDGTIVQCVGEENGAWANGGISAGHDPWWSSAVNPNNLTISIEHVKSSTDNSDSLTQAEQEASFQLIRDICQRWNIPMRSADLTGGITGHFSLDPINRSHCPGSYPWNQLWAYLQNGGNMQIYDSGNGDFDAYFTVNNSDWVCKKFNTVIMGGNKVLYQNLSIDGQSLPVIGLPRTNEIYQHESDGYSWSVQFCERGLIVYDPEHRQDSQPGLGSSYLGKYAQFQKYDPLYQAVVVEKLPADIQSEIKQLMAVAAKYQ